MKLKLNSRRSALLALAALPLGVLPLGAAIVTQPAVNDVFLGIRASGGTGETTAYLVNLGQYSTFSGAAPGSTFTLNIGNVGADLADIFGSNWNTRNDLYWGIVGTNNGVNPAVIASREEGLAAWPSIPLDDRTIANGAILSIEYATNGYTGKESTTNSAVAVAQTGATGEGSWIYQVSGSPLDFGTWSSIETSVAGGKNLELYRIANGGVSNPGSFSLGPDGSLGFAAIPEPSVSFLILTSAAALVGRRRRLV